MISDNNPFCWPLKHVQEMVQPVRKDAGNDNSFVHWEKIFSDTVTANFNYFRDVRDYSQEILFKSLYDNPWMNSIFQANSSSEKVDTSSMEALTKKVPPDKAQLRKNAEKGGFVEACIRVISAIIYSDKTIDIREFQLAEEIIQTSKRLRAIPPLEYQKIAREQITILNTFPRRSLELISKMIPEPEDRKKVLEIAERMVNADIIIHKNENKLLQNLQRILT
jgi:hypothetical protein